jgi:midasin
VVRFYKRARALSAAHQLLDGAGQAPRYSLRTLVRALESARKLVTAMNFAIARALHEGFAATMVTCLASESQGVLRAELEAFFPGGGAGAAGQAVRPKPDFVVVAGFRLPRGPLQDLAEGAAASGTEEFVMTASVSRNVSAVARAVVLAKYPVLLQGPTSAGKTSLVQHLAKLSGHEFVRINNHEHTDLQE